MSGSILSILHKLCKMLTGCKDCVILMLFKQNKSRQKIKGSHCVAYYSMPLTYINSCHPHSNPVEYSRQVSLLLPSYPRPTPMSRSCQLNFQIDPFSLLHRTHFSLIIHPLLLCPFHPPHSYCLLQHAARGTLWAPESDHIPPLLRALLWYYPTQNKSQGFIPCNLSPLLP